MGLPGAPQGICRLLQPLTGIARRCGLWWATGELEESVFRLVQPERYRVIRSTVGSRRQNREAIRKLAVDLQYVLAAHQIEAAVTGRPKRIWSIHRKMERAGLPLDEIYDIRALRVIVDDTPTCYTALRVIHWTYDPIPGEFDDYIENPKANGYRSLHTAVLDDTGHPFEVQIRTHQMHRTAEMGTAAHWRYKESTAAYPFLDPEMLSRELGLPSFFPRETAVTEAAESVY